MTFNEDFLGSSAKNIFFVGGRCLHEYIVGLVALHPGDVFGYFYQFLLGWLVTAFAGRGTGGLVFCGDFSMTFNAGDMGGLAQGFALVLLVKYTGPDALETILHEASGAVTFWVVIGTLVMIAGRPTLRKLFA